MNIKQLHFVIYLIGFLLVPMQALAASEKALTPAMENPGYVEKPEWFKVSFLEFDEDITEAAENGKRVLLFFYQDGCPYCKKLIEESWGQRDIVEKTRKYFDVIAVNIWGDREVTISGRTMTEKQFAAALKVQYTPTMLFFNENSKVVYRANGYYPEQKFVAMLDYVGQHMEEKMDYQAWLEKQEPKKSTGKLHTADTNITTPNDLSKTTNNGRHLLVMFEQKKCATCDELHLDILQRKESREQMARMDIAVLDMWSNDEIIRPDGEEMTVREWAKELDIRYAPSMVYFDDKGNEVFRTDAYLKAFHVQSIMDYVASGAYKEEPNFQRFIDKRANRLREQGVTVNLMD